MRTIEPSLKGEYFGGFFTPSDFTGDIHKFTRGLMEFCRRQGAQFIMRPRCQILLHLTIASMSVGLARPSISIEASNTLTSMLSLSARALQVGISRLKWETELMFTR